MFRAVSLLSRQYRYVQNIASEEASRLSSNCDHGGLSWQRLRILGHQHSKTL